MSKERIAPWSVTSLHCESHPHVYIETIQAVWDRAYPLVSNHFKIVISVHNYPTITVWDSERLKWTDVHWLVTEPGEYLGRSYIAETAQALLKVACHVITEKYIIDFNSIERNNDERESGQQRSE